MGKALKTVGMVVGAAALVATGAGALLMPGMGQVTLFGLTTGQLNMLSTGLMAVGGMLDKPQSAGSGSADEWTSNPDQPIPFAFGRVGVAGKIVHRDEYGPDNRLQGIVSVYSGAGPIKAFISYKADGAAVTFEANGGTAIGKFNRQMWRSWRLGAQPDTALALPTGLDGGAVMPGWGASHRLSGKACDLLTVQQDSKYSVYPTGLPTPQVELDGIYGYDPRYDDTYPGGAGTCRLGIRSTYRWIDNPIIAGLNWALGLVENGQVVGGIGASINGIDVPAFVEAANIADVNNWKVTAWPDTSEDVSEVLKQFLQAGGASYARHAGKISCVSRGAARPSIVTITGRDTAGAIELDTGASLFNKLNTITPEFMSAAHGWKHVPANPVTFEALRLEDGGKRSDSIRYRFVPSALQAGQLAAYDILDAREPFAGTVPLKPHLRQLKRGDCFVIDEPGFLLDGVKCLVLSRTYDPTKGEVRIAFRSETDGKHDLALGKTATVPSYPALTAPDPTYVTPPQPGDWVVIPRLPNEDAVEIPIIDIVGEVGNSTATGMRVEWGFEPDPPAPDPLPEGAVWADYVDWHSAGVWPVTATRIPLEGAPPGSQVYVALSYQRGQNWSAREVQGPVTVPGLVAGGLSPDSPDWQTIRDLANGEAAAQLIADAEGRMQAALTAAQTQLEAADTAINTALSGLQTQLSDLGMDDLEGWAAWSTNLQTTLDGKATVTALNGLAGRVTTAEGTLATQNTRLSTVETGLAGKAAASELTNLATRVTTAESVNTAQNTRLNTVESDIAGKASATEVSTLRSEVEAARNGSTNLNAQLTSMRQVSSDLQTGKANASDLTNLQATVTGQGITIGSHSTRLTTVESDLAGKASSSSVTQLQSMAGAKTRVFRQPTEPGNPANGYPLSQGDLWIRNGTGNNEELHLWTGTAWVLSHDPRIASTAGQVTSLSSTVSTHQQAISDLQTGKAAASDLVTLTSRVSSAEGVNSAQNTRLSTVESALDGKASASSVTSLEATVSNVPRIYWIATEPSGPRRINDIWYKNGDSNRPHLWTSNGWIAIDDTRVAALQAATSTLQSNITSQQAAIADLQTGKAEASAVTNLTARVGSAESSLVTVQSVAADAYGKAFATYGVLADTNGRAFGFQFAGGSTSTFDVRIDKFRVTDGAATSVPFTYEGGVLTAGSLRLKGSININNLFTVSSTGAVMIKSSNGTSRLEQASDAIKIFNAGQLRVQIGNLAA